MGWSLEFTNRINSRQLTVGVVGLGYVGLPTALGFHDAGFSVRGVDLNRRLIDNLRRGLNPGDDPTIDALLPDSESDRWMVGVESEGLLSECDVILITVPTPVDANRLPDLSYIESAGRSIFSSVEQGERTIVILESTVYPGVTREILLPLLQESGLEIGVDIELAYCPERFVPGDPEHGVRQVPRVIGAMDDNIGEDLVALYSTLTSGNVDYVGGLEVAEAAKVVENVQRDMNIALVNELAMILPQMGLDVEAVLDAAATKWNFHRYTPGVGVGGHCIPVDPHYLMRKAAVAGTPAELITAARAVNQSMPSFVSRRIIDILIQHEINVIGSTVLIIGWSYKPGISDARETPAEPLAAALRTHGARILVWDPHVVAENLPDHLVESVEDLDQTPSFDIAVIVTAHDEIFEIDWTNLIERARNPLLFDGRRVFQIGSGPPGWTLHSLGSPSP